MKHCEGEGIAFGLGPVAHNGGSSVDTMSCLNDCSPSGICLACWQYSRIERVGLWLSCLNNNERRRRLPYTSYTCITTVCIERGEDPCLD